MWDGFDVVCPKLHQRVHRPDVTPIDLELLGNVILMR